MNTCVKSSYNLVSVFTIKKVILYQQNKKSKNMKHYKKSAYTLYTQLVNIFLSDNLHIQLEKQIERRILKLKQLIEYEL